MGLFDYVVVECPIEGVDNPEQREWQTKEFDAPFMLRYKITADGRLMEPIVHTEDRSDPTAEPGSWRSLAGSATVIYDGYQDMNYHGDLHMCGDEALGYADYVARFTEGQLAWIRLSPTGDGK